MEKKESEVAQSFSTLCDPIDCSPPGSSVHGIFQARVLEWGAIAFSELNTKSPINRTLLTPKCVFCFQVWKMRVLELVKMFSPYYSYQGRE